MKRDLTRGTEWKAILLFSLPIMAGNFLQQLYNTVDGVVVGRVVGESALGAVGTCGNLGNLCIAVAIGMSTGCSILLAQTVGARRTGDIKPVAATSLLLLGGIGIIITALGFIFSDALLRGFMNIGPAEMVYAAPYFRIYCAGILFQYIYNVIAGLLRAVGDSRATLLFLAVAAAVNIGLDLLFVAALGMGAAGAAWATVIAQICCCAVSAVYMFKKYEMFRFKRGEFVFSGEKCSMCLRLGIPTTIHQCVVMFGMSCLQRLVNSFGTAPMAGYVAGARIEAYMTIPLLGLSTGMSTFASQNMGAGNTDRIKRGWLGAEITGLIITGIFSTCAWLFAVPAARIFGVEGASLDVAVGYIKFLSFFFMIFTVFLISNAVLQGSGDVLSSTGIVMVNLGLRVAAAYIMVKVFGFDWSACWKCVPIGWTVVLFLSTGRYLSGAWKKKGLVSASPEKDGG